MQVKLAYHANCWGALGGNAVGVTSITQLTYRTFGDMERAIGEIGEAGYAGTELFDGNLLDYEGRYGVLRSALKQSGVALVAGYSGANFIFNDILSEELARIERAAAAAAGGDPAAQIREFRNRISYVHLKGWQREPFAFKPLDRGDLDMAPIIGALRDTGFSGWIATELDAWPDPKQGAELSMKYLKEATRPS